ncbi:MAG: tripartite tricarboxylate transporter substrate binding protein [Betaproteobacteria bacterium]|nr:MAG: tripartite tricarboxylate transporter substrate binding protein [Betaproteobacteria bacterium]
MKRLALLAAAALLPVCVSAQTYPTRAIKIVVAFPAGGGSDLAARVVAQKLSEGFGQPVVVENRVGANGSVGAEAVARAAPDGYTLVMGSNANITTNPHLMALSYDPMKDLAPVAMLTVNPLLLFVNPAVVPVASFREFLDYVRAREGKVDYASAGNGSPAHLSGELLKLTAGIKMVHVPYKGGPPGVNDVLGGRVGVMLAAAPTVLPHIRAGKLRGIVTTGAHRTVFAPEIPTIAESGFPDFDVVIWNALFAPSATPGAVLAKLHGEIGRILAQPDTKELLLNQGAEVQTMTDAAFRELLKAEYERWGKVIREAKIKVD